MSSAGKRGPQDQLPTRRHADRIAAATERPVSRRRFLKTAAIGTAALSAARELAGPRAAWGNRERSRVVCTHHPEATSNMQTVHQDPVDEMVHTAVRALTGIPDTAAAWRSLFPGITADRTIGIKINLACGDVPTHPEVVNAIIDGLLMMDLDGQQLPPEQIIVWDMDTAFFCPQTGYTVNWGGPGVQYVGTDHPAIGFDYTRIFAVQHASQTTHHHGSRILTEFCDYQISAAVIKDHDDWAGVTLCLKNLYGAFDNIPIVAMHYSGFDTGIPGLSMILRDELADVTKLFLVDATLGLYDGGPGYTPPYHTPPNWACNSLLASRDPVAIDRMGTIMINEERGLHPPLAPLDPGHVTAAGRPPYELGTEDPDKIDLVSIELGAQDIASRGPAAGGVTLLAPYPNPMRGSCTLRFHCTAAIAADLVITDATGAVVRRIAAGRRAAGVHRLAWDGRDQQGRAVASGTYFCRLQVAGAEQRRSIVLLH